MNWTGEILKQIESLGPYRIVLPFAVFFGSFIVSKLFKIPLAVVIIFALLPLGLPFLHLPFSSQLTHDYPLAFIFSGWIVMLALVAGRFLARVVFGALSPSKSLGGVFSLGTAACFLVVTVLLINPALMERYWPGWKGSLGLALISFAMLGFTLSCFRFLRAGGLIIFWACLCAVLGGEVFLNKLPQDYLGQNFEQLSPLFKSLRIVPGGKTQSNKVSVAILGGSQLAGADSYPRQLERLLNRSQSAQKIEVLTYMPSRATINSLQRTLVNNVLPKSPDIIVVSGWFDDYLEAKDRGELSADPSAQSKSEGGMLLSAISQLSVVRAAKSALGAEDPLNHQPGVERYRLGLTEMTQLIKKAGAIPILFSEPVAKRGHQTEQAIYDRVTQSVAAGEDAGFVNIDTSSANYDYLFEGENVLSAAGEQAVARKIMDAVIEARAAKGGGSLLAKALESIRTAASSIIVPTKELNNLVTVSFNLDKPQTNYRARFAINDTIVHEQQFAPDEATRASFKVPREYADYPAVKLSVAAAAAGSPERDLRAGIVGVNSQGLNQH